ncbi:MAG: extracellular solute-binding protein [Anaerolineales bacterium]|nr:extracellular solute-binding protein [Anaerolineales bacterium]
MYRNPKIAAVLLVFLCAALFSACQSGGTLEVSATPSASAPQETASPMPSATVIRPRQQGSIEIWTSWEDDKLEVLTNTLVAFQESFPDIVVSIRYYSEQELYEAFREGYQQGQSPTILISRSNIGPDLKRSNMVSDLTERIPETYQQEIYQHLWSQITYDQQVIGLPLEQVGYVLIRNRQLMPDRAATVDDLATSARSVTDGLVIGAALDLGFPISSSFMTVCNSLLTDAYLQPAFNTDEGICWMELLARLHRIGKTSFNDDEDLNFFLQDRAAWIIAETSQLKSVSEEIGENWVAVDFWPIYDANERRLAGYVWTENAYLVSGHSMEDTELSWAFLSYLTSLDVQTEITRQLGIRQIPVLEAVPLDDLLLRQAVFVLERGIEYPVELDLDLFARGMEPEMLDVLQGGDPGLALERAEKSVEKLLAGS